MKRLLYMLFFLLAVHPLRAEKTTNWTPVLPPDPGATFTVVLEDEPYGAAELTGGGIYKNDDSVSIYCVPKEGYRFLRWTLNGELFATTPQYSFSMPEDNLTLVAELELLPKHHLTLTAEPLAAAVLNGEGDYYPGTVVSITCTMDEDYTFSHWTKNGVKFSEDKDVLFTMEDKDVVLVAVCQYTPNSLITIESNDNAAGIVSMTGGRYAIGQQLEFVATARKNYIFSHWELNGAYYSDKATVNYTVVNEDAHFVAVFNFMPAQPDDPSTELTSVVYIEAEPLGAATFNIQSGTRYNEGDTLLIQAELRSDYEFVGWYINDVCVATSPAFMYIVGSSDATIVLRAKQTIYRMLTLKANPQNTVHFNVADQTTIKEGDQVMLQANVLPDYTFLGWYEANTLLSKDLTFLYTMPTRDVTLVAMTEKNTSEEWNPDLPSDPEMETVYIEVISADATMGKTIGSAHYTIGSTITIQAIPYTGYHFVQWNDGNTEPIRTLEVTDATTYIAQFDVNQYNVLVLSNDENMGTVKGSGTYAYLTKANIQATAKQGYQFEKWSDNNTCTSRSISVTGDFVLIAEFSAMRVKLNVVSSNVNAGMVTGSGSYLKGESVIITAIANDGYNFIQWSDGNTQAERIVVVDEEQTYTAYFVPKQYDISLTVNDNKMGYVRGNGTYAYATDVEITAIPYFGYHFDQWSDGNDTNPRIVHLTTNTSLTAIFHIAQSVNDTATICYGEEYLWHGRLYNTSGVYTAIADNKVDTLFLTVLPEVPTTEVSDTICYGEPYTWNGETYIESGDYSVSLTNINGCDSIVNLHLTINHAQSAKETITVCDSYTWNGETYTQSGDYVYTTVATNGCDSIVTLHLTINNTQYAEETVTACDTYTWNGETYTESGEYVYTTTAANGCDSIITLHLTINATKYAEEIVTACDSYTWNDETYTESGEYTYNTTAANGCDSIVTLHLTINAPKYTEETVTACDSYVWNGETYTESGEYTYNTTAANGCDSIITLHLTINATKYAEETVSACDSYTWNGNTYTASGDYEYYTITEQGCERVEVLHLTINRSEREEYYETACNEYWWHDHQYTESGDYEYYTTTDQGCERVEVLHLTINRSEREEYWETACDVYEWHGQYYYESGDYEYYTTTDQDCERVEVLHLTISHSEREEYNVTACNEYWWHNNQYTESGDYEYYTTTDQGCERVEVLHLTINRSEREEYYETACDEYWWHDNQYTESGDYEYYTTTDQGCERVEVLHLTINRSEREEYNVTACDQYEWHGEVYTESGTYEYHTTTNQGCERVEVLYLTISDREHEEYYETACDEFYWDHNGQTYYESGDYIFNTTAANGCERTEVLHLTINHSEHQEYYENACDAYEWHGNTYTESGDYEYRTTLENGCERVEVLHLTIYNSQYEEYWETACDEYWWNGEIYTESGEYTYSYPLYNWGTGTCDRTEVLHLTINHSEYEEYWETACDAYEWHGNTYTESSDYEYRTTLENGCERVEVLHLTINRSEREEYWETACDEFWWHDNQYTESGDYEYYTTTDQGCERVEVLYLTINRSEREEYNVTACDQYEWHGEVYTESGTYEYHTTTEQGCERVEVLYLTISDREHEEYYETACDEFYWNHNGQTYYESGDYIFNTTAANGCERTEVLHLTINHSEHQEYYENACDAYEWHGNTYTESGNYEYRSTLENGCERVEVLHLIIYNSQYEEYWETACDEYLWNGEIYTESGEYTYSHPLYDWGTGTCDRTEVLHLTINHSEYEEYWETACDAYEWHGETYTQSGKYEYRSTLENGCERIEVLHLTIYNSQYEEYWETACDEYWWNGNQYTESGDYTYSYPIYNWGTGTCDRTEVLHLTINKRDTVHYYETACDEYWWNPYGQYYNISGDYENYTTNEYGCERVEILHLTLNHSEREEYWENACDAYEWHGNTYTESGDYEYRTTLENGCERVEVLHLTIYNSQYEEYWETACDKYFWWNGQYYYESGDYTYSYPLYNWGTGTCDRTEVLHLTINKRDTVHYYETACDAYEWHGQYYNISGDYEYYTTTDQGCERVEVLHLTINKSEYIEETVTACDSYEWNGLVYTESGDYTYTTTTDQGCERIEVLHLTINRSEREEYSVTECDQYEWHGEVYTESGTYEYHTTTEQGCERVEVLHLTINKSERVEETVTSCYCYEWNELIYTESGDYEFYTTTDQGCERIEVLHLTILPYATTESEELALCPSELPYEWYGQTLTEAGLYTATEQYAGMECDSVFHELTLNVYVQTLPAAVTLPIVRTGEAIDVTTPTAEIQAHIAAETWYAPNAEVAWYILENSDWTALTDEPVAASITEVIIKYAVETDCGNIESDKMVIAIEPTGVENIHSPSPISNCRKILYEDHIYILREGKVYSVMGQEL